MINIYLANNSKQSIGGSWSFLRHLKKGLEKDNNFRIVDKVGDCDIFFIHGATAVDKNLVKEAKEKNKKIITRCDNLPKNSRNKNAGFTRLQGYSKISDLVIYQSEWCMNYLSPVLGGKNKIIIVNGSDDSIFKPEGAIIDSQNRPVYLYIRSSNDETKEWHRAWYYYQLLQRKDVNAILWILGRFSPDNHEYNFDFSFGERYEYKGFAMTPEQMAIYMRSADYLFFPFFNDAASQTLCEWILTKNGIDKILLENGTGGNPDIINGFKKYGREFLSMNRMVNEYKEEFCHLLMGKRILIPNIAK